MTALIAQCFRQDSLRLMVGALRPLLSDRRSVRADLEPTLFLLGLFIIVALALCIPRSRFWLKALLMVAFAGLLAWRDMKRKD